jgi:hypothetical protein
VDVRFQQRRCRGGHLLAYLAGHADQPLIDLLELIVKSLTHRYTASLHSLPGPYV